MKHSSSKKVPSSASSPSPTPSAAKDLTTPSNGGGNEAMVVERGWKKPVVCRWTVQGFPRLKAFSIWSKNFEVSDYDCRLLLYPRGDSLSVPGNISIYLQITDPRSTSSSEWNCFASYRVSIVNLSDGSKTIYRDTWNRFSAKSKLHGWFDFTAASSVLDPGLGYLSPDDSVLITADILVLKETVSFAPDTGAASDYSRKQQKEASSSALSSGRTGGVSDVLSGKFTWNVHNFSLFREMIKTQKITSPVFPAGECNLKISVYLSPVNGQDYLSICLESEDPENEAATTGNAVVADWSCWCLFRMSVLNQKRGMSHTHRDSYGRFAADNKSGDNTSLGWNDYMKMSDFLGQDSGFLVDDTAVFSTSFHVIKEFCSFSKSEGWSTGGRSSGNVANRKSDGYMGKFTWRIENFTKLKDLLKKRKITGLCIKSRRFQIGNRDCRLIVYPRGQSQPASHLSVFLQVTDTTNPSGDWSCLVSHRLSVVNQSMEENSVTKESQNLYSKAAKEWGWREFVALTSFFAQDSGFLVQDTVIFTAEVLILNETTIMQELTDQ